MKYINVLISSLLLAVCSLEAQEDDLLSLLDEGETTEYIAGAFKSTRVIHGHSIENLPGGELDVRFSHRFGALNTGFYELYGLDNAMVRLGADYGITDQLMIGVGRSSFQDIYDGFVKYKFLRQSKGKRTMPLSAAFMADIEYMATKTNPDPEQRSSSRFAYAFQLLLGRKFGDGFTLQLAPALVHRNLVDFNEMNNVYSLGIGARQKITKRISVTLEYYWVPGDQLPSDEVNSFYNSLAIGFDIQTGGHVFQLHFTNSTSMAYRGFIAETNEKWSDGGIHFGFNISRIFTVKKAKID